MKSLYVVRKYNDDGTISRDITPRLFSYDEECVRNTIESKCLTLKNELPYNTSIGIVLGDNKSHMDLVVSEMILTTGGVSGIKSFESNLDRQTHKYNANIVVDTVFNKQIEVNV